MLLELKSSPLRAATIPSCLFTIRLRSTRRRASGEVFSCSIVSSREGEIIISVKGEDAWLLFKNESGGHRWQRVPPTETKGRRHSSTFTVAVFRETSDAHCSFDESEIEYKAVIGHGPGGQHRNKTATAIQAVHVPTGERVFIQDSKSQRTNIDKAKAVLAQRVTSAANTKRHNATNADRKEQIGRGERSDKIRTVQEQNGIVTDHRTGRKCPIAAYLKGEIWRLAKRED